MSDPMPTREAAEAALSEARIRESQVRGSDVQLGRLLAIIVVADLGIAGLMSVAPHLAGPAVLVLYASAIGLVVPVFVRIRAYSRTGLMIFTVSAFTFALANGLVSAVSVATRWWSPSQPSFHLGVSEAICALPLLVGIWLLSRKGR